MKVSIVIPAYNEEEFIAQTLKTVCALDYPDFEVIVVDNASTDKTSEIAKQFPVKVVFEKNKGLLYARERGRVEATGDIIANIDADCVVDSDWLSKAIPLFKNKKVIAVSGPYDYFDGSPVFRAFSLSIQKYMYTAMSHVLRFMNKGGIIIGGNNLIRADILREVGGYDTSILFYGEDTDTAKKISKKGQIVFSGKICMKTSARRFQREGTLRISVTYLFHFIRVAFFPKKKKHI